jgi:hypothetical protein
MATCNKDFSDVLVRVQEELSVGELSSIELKVDEWNSTLLIKVNGLEIATVAVIDHGQWQFKRDVRIRTEVVGLVAKLNELLPQPMNLEFKRGWSNTAYRWLFGIESHYSLEAAEREERTDSRRRSESYQGTWPEDSDSEYPPFYLDWLRKYQPELVQ